MKYDIKCEFGKQAKKFRLQFGLSQKELANLSKMSPSEYGSLEKGITNYNVEKLQNVASVYGLVYYQFGNPICSFPTFNKLPKETRKVISSRKIPLKIYKERLIVEHLTLIIGEMSKGSEFLITHLGAKINKEFRVNYKAEEIADTIKKNLSDYVVNTNIKNLTKEGPGAKSIYYKLIKEIPYQILIDAKEKVGK